MKAKTGLILFTYNKPDIDRPLSIISSIINFFQTGRLRNKNHLPTHTAQTLVLEGKLYVIDSDWDGVEPEPFEKWKRNRAWIHVFDPRIINNKQREQEYIDKAMDKSGIRYGYEDIKHWLKYQVTGKFGGETNPLVADDNMLCSYFTGYLYNYVQWWMRSPLNLFEKRFIDAPLGEDLASGKPEFIIFS